LAQQVREQNRAQGKTHSVLELDGRGWAAALKDLRDLGELVSGDETLDETRLPDLYFDDLDVFIQNIDALRRERCEEMLRDLTLVVSTLSRRDRSCVASSTLSQSRLQGLLVDLYKQRHVNLAVIDAASTLFASFDTEWLDPWRGDWEGRIGRLLEVYLKPLTRAAQGLARSLLLELTGGHPALLARAFEHLDRLLASEGSSLGERLCREGADPGPLERDLRTFLEDALLRQGLGSLRRALIRLESAEKPELQAAHGALLAFAQDGERQPPAASRDILLGEGLLFRDPADSTYKIPGELLRQELLSAAGSKLAFDLVPEEADPHLRGRLEIREGARRLDLELSGGPWSILQTLFEAAPRFVSLKDLQERTHLKTDNAVRSAIQRLTAELRTAGIEGLVENQYGTGYRRGDAPSWSSTA
jgi:hypothetical protein